MDEVTKKIESFNRKLAIGIATLATGVVTLAIGVVLLVVTLNRQPVLQDAEALIGSWQREDEPRVVWDFTDFGKGSLTTNAHENDFDFVWAIEDGKLLIETDWLYVLNDEFQYELKDGKLILDDKIVFVPAI